MTCADPAHVWYLGKSGKHVLGASPSHFDPKPDVEARRFLDSPQTRDSFVLD
jgi:hypothetical protein